MKESQLIKELTKNLKYPKNVIKGVGDDCAVIGSLGDKVIVATMDCQVENVHFVKDFAKPEQIGKKAIAVNISDIASMGAKPTYCLVTILIPPQTNEKFVKKMYDGIIDECKKYNVSIIGGNISKANELIIDICMLGQARKNEIIYREGAKPGDLILVTGNIGDAVVGLEFIKNKLIHLNSKDKALILKKQLEPTPRLSESEIIRKSKLATSMIDISDGVAGDLSHICKQSGVGAEIWEEKLPVSSAMLNVAKQININYLELALSRGEDYELLFTCAKNKADELVSSIKEKTGTKVTVIGRILKEKKMYIRLKNGERKTLEAKGWDHLKNFK